MHARLSAVILALTIAAGWRIAGQEPPPVPLGERWRSHVAYLASDELEGRNTGSEGYNKAAKYVAAQFERAGLQPGTASGFLQPVRFTVTRLIEERSRVALVRDGQPVPLAFGTDLVVNVRVPPAPAVNAALVFAGHGLVIPEINHDDLRGLDVAGKVVVLLGGAPPAIPGALAAHSQSAGVRWPALRAAGAVGTITIPNPRLMDVPWERSSANRLLPAMSLAGEEFDEAAGQQIALTVNPANAEKLFAGSGHTFSEILELANRGRPLPHFALPAALSGTFVTESAEAESHNVVGFLSGSDPAVQHESVVLSAHLDHVGIGAPIDGDRIYNGAMDNASGVAALIEAGRLLAAGAPPRRSLVFVALTAEEKGLLGSRYFAANPTVARESLVANINMDMFLPLFPLKTLMVLGLDESTLGDTVRRVATTMGIGVQADPEPQRNRFIRSDQYNFIRQGVPAIAMKVGYAPGSPESATAAAWTKTRYHAPSDDLAQPMDLQAAGDFTQLVAALADTVANDSRRPRWKADSFFQRFAPGGGGQP